MNPVQKTCSIEDIERTEKSLFPDEKISLIFLLYDDAKVALECATLCEERTVPLRDWILHQPGGISNKDWKKKFCEALAIVGNYQLLSYLFNIDQQEASIRYMPKETHTSLFVPLLRKCLYILCEQLTEKECSNFVAVLSAKYQCRKKYTPLNLEVYFLDWLANGIISLANMEPVYHALQKIGRKDLLSYLENIKIKEKKILNAEYDKDSFYNINPVNTGLCIIINQKSFSLARNHFKGFSYDDRIGTDVDRDNLLETFLMFGYRVEVLTDLTKPMLRTKMLQLCKEKIKSTDCSLVVCVLSHGEKDVFYCSDGEQEKIDNLRAFFCARFCTELIGKPKLFFIQACQGTFYQPVRSRPFVESDIAVDSPSMGTNPPQIVNAGDTEDFLTFFSTVAGYLSFRNKIKGSIFINAVCSQLTLLSHELPLSNIVTRIVNESSNNISIGSSLVRSTAEHKVTLRKEIKFKYNENGIIESTKKKLQRKLFDLSMREFLLNYCRENFSALKLP